mmetsp:Transcript_120115/g.384729  ORF Transcript_120115/g.384729 Transcript_120115/m.384729 type:complete len:219 (-) Transcript_120115:2503-3159(-)
MPAASRRPPRSLCQAASSRCSPPRAPTWTAVARPPRCCRPFGNTTTPRSRPSSGTARSLASCTSPSPGRRWVSSTPCSKPRRTPWRRTMWAAPSWTSPSGAATRRSRRSCATSSATGSANTRPGSWPPASCGPSARIRRTPTTWKTDSRSGSAPRCGLVGVRETPIRTPFGAAVPAISSPWASRAATPWRTPSACSLPRRRLVAILREETKLWRPGSG